MPPISGRTLNGAGIPNAPNNYQQDQYRQSNGNDHSRLDSGRAPRAHANSNGDHMRAPILRSGGMNGNALNDLSVMNDDPNILHGSDAVPPPTPMFERLVTEEVQELKTYVRIVENQNRRISELEEVQNDLENRLEIEVIRRQHLEATLETREREWAEKLEHVESDRDHWKALVGVEKAKNSKLIDQVVRKDQDIHRMLQRKVTAVLCQ
jgi:hypothetical protein